MDFVELIRSLSKKSEWIAWLSKGEGKVAAETLDLLSKCYSKIPAGKQGKIRKRFQSGDLQEIDSIIFELVAYEFLRRLNLQPEWSPIIKRFNPDLKFYFGGVEFIADVILVKSPSRTIKEHGRVVESWDKMWIPGESRAKKIADRIAEKTIKYAMLQYPLVVFIFLGDHFLLEPAKVEKALYGMTVDEVLLERNYPLQLDHGYPYPGLLLPCEDQQSRYENLAAVAVCEWFDTLNLADEGKRLRCTILHNWSSACMLPTHAFASFGQVVWRKVERERWEPHRVGDTSMVAKFTNEDDIEIKPYSPPW